MSVDLAGKRSDQLLLLQVLVCRRCDSVAAALRDAGGSALPDGSGVSVGGWTVQTVKAPILSTLLSLARHVDHHTCLTLMKSRVSFATR